MTTTGSSSAPQKAPKTERKKAPAKPPVAPARPPASTVPAHVSTEAEDLTGSAAPARGAIKVRATQKGYYDNKRRRVGDVFLITKESEFSKKWMERVDRNTPERLTTGRQELKQQHDEVVSGRLGLGTGDVDVLK